MFEMLSGMKTVQEIESWNRVQGVTQSDSERRQKIKIGVIDDQVFEAGKNLRNMGYNVTELGDVKSVQETEPYHLVLCDLQGVGVSFSSRFEGGFIIDEIKKAYPDKFVVAYTGGALEPAALSFAQLVADDFIRS